MSQHCVYCGKTEKQHLGKTCLDAEVDYCDPTSDGPEVGLIMFFRNFPEGIEVPYPKIWRLA